MMILIQLTYPHD